MRRATINTMVERDLEADNRIGIGYLYTIYRVSYADARLRSGKSKVLFITKENADSFVRRHRERGLEAEVEPIQVTHSEMRQLRMNCMLEQ